MSDEQTVTMKKRGRPRKVEAPDVPLEAGPQAAPDSPGFDTLEPQETRRKKQVEVVQRRLKGGHLFSQPSQAIPLKDKAMRVRWFNRGISDDRFFVAEQQKGWMKVHISDVDSLDAVSGYDRTPEGYITRGPRGQEMLYMMPKADYQAIQMAKAAANTKRLGSAKSRAAAAAEATAAQFGPQAGDYVEKAGGETNVWRGPAD